MSASRQPWVEDERETALADDSPSGPQPMCISFDSPAAFAGATQAALAKSAEAEAAHDACDVCGEPVLDDDDDGPAVTGHGLYVWTRGDETRREEAPLCASCAAALGLSALARWEIDEEEG